MVRLPGVFSSLRGAAHLHYAAEPFHSVVYYSEEPLAASAAVGLEGWSHYLLQRCAPLAAAPASVITSLVFSLDAALVPPAWRPLGDRLQGKEATSIVLEATGRAVHRLLRGRTDGLAAAADLACAAVAACDTRGRPLAAAWAGVDSQDEPHVRLWHAVTVLREHRAAGHAAVLLTRGITADEAHVLAATTAGLDPRAIHRQQNKKPAQWDAAYDDLLRRGWIDRDGEMTPRGATAWQRVARDTDALDQEPLRALGPSGCVSLHRALLAASDRVVAAGEFPWPNAQALQWRFKPRRDHR